MKDSGANQAAFPATEAEERSTLALTARKLWASLLMLQLFLRASRKLALALGSWGDARS